MRFVADAVHAWHNKAHIGARDWGERNPNNQQSKKVLNKLMFQYIGAEYNGPTSLYHPSYKLHRSE